VVANDPYIFIRINRLNSARYIDVKLASWPEMNLPSMNVVQLPSCDPLRAEIVSGSASFHFDPTRNAGFMCIQGDDFRSLGRSYENRLLGVSILQQSRNMRRSVPAALLLAALVAVTMIWMTFQTKQRSLLQAAELVDRSRRYEPIDILDDAEVMAFYKSFLASSSEEKPADPYDEHMKKTRSDKEAK
jgi:hypothetical protein